MHAEALGPFLRSLVSLHSLTVRRVDPGNAGQVTLGLGHARPPLAHAVIHGNGLGFWLPGSLNWLMLVMNRLVRDADCLRGLPAQLLAFQNLRHLELHLSGEDPFLGPGGDAPVSAAALRFFEAPELHRCHCLRVLIVRQRLEQSCWRRHDPDSDEDEFAAMRYMVQLHEAACSSVHGLQMRTHLLPALQLFCLNLWMLVTVEHLAEDSDSAEVVVEDTEVIRACADSRFGLTFDGTFRQVRSHRHLHWSPAGLEDQGRARRHAQPGQAMTGRALSMLTVEPNLAWKATHLGA